MEIIDDPVEEGISTCRACGQLAQALADSPRHVAFVEVPTQFRKPGGASPVCFGMHADLPREISDSRARHASEIGDKAEAGDRALMEVLRRDRYSCGFIPYRQGFSPREHAERLARDLEVADARTEQEKRTAETTRREDERDQRADERQRQREEARDRVAEEREQFRDARALAADAERDQRAESRELAREEAAIRREADRELIESKRHHRELWVLGGAVSLATIVSSVLGSMIDAGWIVRPPWW